MTKPTTTFQNWKHKPLTSWRKNRSPKPPLSNNPSMISQLSKQRKPISLAKVWK